MRIRVPRALAALLLFASPALPVLAGGDAPSPLQRIHSDPQWHLVGTESVLRVGEDDYFVWRRYADWKLQFAVRRGGGPLQLLGILMDSVPYTRPASLASDGKNLYATVVAGAGVPRAYFTKSADGGVTWSKPLQVTPDTMWARMAVFENELYVVAPLFEGGLSVYRSLDQGESWQLFRDEIASEAWGVNIEVDQKAIHLAWNDGIERSIWHAAISRVNGVDRYRTRLHAGQGQLPEMKKAGESILISWVDQENSPPGWPTGDTLLARSDDDGRGWGEAVALTTNHRVWPGTITVASDRADSGRFSVAWLDNERSGGTLRFDAFLAESVPNGSRVPPAREVTSAYFPNGKIGGLHLESNRTDTLFFAQDPEGSEDWSYWRLRL